MIKAKKREMMIMIMMIINFPGMQIDNCVEFSIIWVFTDRIHLHVGGNDSTHM